MNLTLTSYLTEANLIPGSATGILGLILMSAINFLVVFLIVHYIYNSSEKTKDYEFSFLLISAVVFFLCFMLGKVELQLGFALGLFAIFGIINYRTDTIPIKEMTYLFLVIAISVINALSNHDVSLVELIFVNLSIIMITFVLERFWKTSQLIKRKIIYERIDLIRPDNQERLIDDLRKRTGLNVFKVDVHDMDLLKDTAELTVYAYKEPIKNEDNTPLS